MGRINISSSASGSTAGAGASSTDMALPRTQSPAPAPGRVITRFAAGHAWTSGTDDTTVKLFGDRSYRGVTNGAGGSLYLSSPTFASVIDASRSVFRLWLRALDPTRISQIQVYVTTGAGNTLVGGVNSNLIAGEWAAVTINRAQFTASAGTPTWTGVTKVEVRLVDKGGSAPATVWLGGVELLPDLATLYPNGVFILEADDGYAGQLTNMLPVTSTRGVPVTFNVIAERFIGNTPSAGMTSTDLRTLQDKQGWQISLHAYAQATHDTVNTTPENWEIDFAQQKAWLHENGLHAGVDEYALCPGTGSPVAEGPLFDALRRTFRSVRVNSGFCDRCCSPVTPPRSCRRTSTPRPDPVAHSSLRFTTLYPAR